MWTMLDETDRRKRDFDNDLVRDGWAQDPDLGLRAELCPDGNRVFSVAEDGTRTHLATMSDPLNTAVLLESLLIEAVDLQEMLEDMRDDGGRIVRDDGSLDASVAGPLVTFDSDKGALLGSGADDTALARQGGLDCVLRAVGKWMLPGAAPEDDMLPLDETDEFGFPLPR